MLDEHYFQTFLCKLLISDAQMQKTYGGSGLAFKLNGATTTCGRYELEWGTDIKVICLRPIFIFKNKIMKKHQISAQN